MLPSTVGCLNVIAAGTIPSEPDIRFLHGPGCAGSSALTERFDDVRALTELLAEPLGPEDQTVQSMPDVSPTKWHRAHTTWFFEEFVLAAFVDGYERVHPAYQYLFNSYYEAKGSRHPRAERGLLSRPTVADVAAYRSAVDEAIRQHLGTEPGPEVLGRIELGLHHEQQHQELMLMDAKHVLSQGPLDTPYLRRVHDEPSGARPGPPTWTEHGGGLVEIGHRDDGFAYDNESPRHATWLEPFALADRPVVVGEWCDFIADGGYTRPELWLSEGWATVGAHGWQSPMYWRDEGAGEWSIFTLTGRRPVDPTEPVCHVSYFEADAFARWSGARLPTEQEWECAAGGVLVDDSHSLDRQVLHPSLPAGDGPLLVYGGVWEWTASAYSPYPGFRAGPGAIGEYNGKFMVNQQVLRGGSCVTPRGHVRPTYRNFFPAAARWAFSGVRLARGES